MIPLLIRCKHRSAGSRLTGQPGLRVFLSECLQPLEYPDAGGWTESGVPCPILKETEEFS